MTKIIISGTAEHTSQQKPKNNKDKTVTCQTGQTAINVSRWFYFCSYVKLLLYENVKKRK